MSIRPIGSSEINVYFSEIAEQEGPSNNLAPASSAAVPIESAKAQVMAASLFASQMLPTADGIFTIGSVALKTSVFGIGTMRGFSTWGF